jgi:hypothetical protein
LSGGESQWQYLACFAVKSVKCMKYRKWLIDIV